MVGTPHEFETLREFFNSSTLVVLIDLPFVFIYAIYLIAGPIAYVPLLAVPLVILVGPVSSRSYRALLKVLLKVA